MQENATTTRDIEVPHISGQGGHVVPAGTRVIVNHPPDESIYISGPSVRATVYVEAEAVDMDISPGEVVPS